MLKKYLSIFLFIGWLVFITSLSLFSFKGFGRMASGIKIPQLDKFVHFTFYFFTTIFGTMALRAWRPQHSLKSASLYLVAFSIVYGTVIEVLQVMLTTDRHGDFLDFIANSLGAFAAWLVLKQQIFIDFRKK